MSSHASHPGLSSHHRSSTRSRSTARHDQRDGRHGHRSRYDSHAERVTPAVSGRSATNSSSTRPPVPNVPFVPPPPIAKEQERPRGMFNKFLRSVGLKGDARSPTVESRSGRGDFNAGGIHIHQTIFVNAGNRCSPNCGSRPAVQPDNAHHSHATSSSARSDYRRDWNSGPSKRYPSPPSHTGALSSRKEARPDDRTRSIQKATSVANIPTRRRVPTYTTPSPNICVPTYTTPSPNIRAPTYTTPSPNIVVQERPQREPQAGRGQLFSPLNGTTTNPLFGSEDRGFFQRSGTTMTRSGLTHRSSLPALRLSGMGPPGWPSEHDLLHLPPLTSPTVSEIRSDNYPLVGTPQSVRRAQGDGSLFFRP
ncbi:hypothetical protein OF83DRAFT_1086674 [Amylostereum chailletii]|nr:hypothetical protein OF83DRAFT_1086674 [Amylostereum chailletii]